MTDGQIDTGITGDIETSITATNPATDTVLSLILSVLSLF
jgi:hypothetical protein